MDSIIKKPSVVSEITEHKQSEDAVTQVEYDGIVKIHVSGAEFPMKGAPTPDALWSVDIVKKIIIEFIKIQNPLSLLSFLSKKRIIKLLESFNRIAQGVMQPYLYYKYFNQGVLSLLPVSRGTGKIIDLFLVNYGIPQETARKTAEFFAHIIEFDGFYRFKLLDIMSEANDIELVNNPRKEVQRLLKICYNREQVIGSYIQPKLKLLIYGTWVLAIPKVRRAFQDAVKLASLSLFKIDETDFYWMSMRTDYHYFGKSFKERMNFIKSRNYKYPSSVILPWISKI